jgi:hypothetical protein
MGRSVGVLVCEAYRDRWEGKNLELVVADTAAFLLKVVLRIKKLEEQEQDLGAAEKVYSSATTTMVVKNWN